MDDLFKGKRADSSDTFVLTASASENTPNITLNLEVLKLAQKEALVTIGGVNNLSTSINLGLL